MISLIIATLLLISCGREAPYTFHGGQIQPVQRAPTFVVNDQHGQPFDLAAQGGNVVMLYFGYTNCPDLCPTTLSTLKEVKQKLGKDAEHLRVAMVTVDPARDTPAALGQYLSNFDPSFIALSPPAAQLAEIEQHYSVQAESSLPGGKLPMTMDAAATTTAGGHDMASMATTAPAASGTSYEVGHTNIVYVIDRSGQMRLFYPGGPTATEIAADMAYLLRH